MNNSQFDMLMKEIKRLFPEEQYDCIVRNYNATNMQKEGLIIHKKGAKLSPSIDMELIRQLFANGVSPQRPCFISKVSRMG